MFDKIFNRPKINVEKALHEVAQLSWANNKEIESLKEQILELQGARTQKDVARKRLTEKPKQVPPDEIAAIKTLILMGYKKKRIAAAFLYSPDTIRRIDNGDNKRARNIQLMGKDMAKAYLYAFERNTAHIE